MINRTLFQGTLIITLASLGCTSNHEDQGLVNPVATVENTEAQAANTPKEKTEAVTDISSDPALDEQAPEKALVEIEDEPAGEQPETIAAEQLDIAAADPSEHVESSTTGRFWVDISHLNVRSGPGMEFNVVRVIKGGTEVSSLSRKGIWVQIAENEFVSIHFLSEQPIQAENARSAEPKAVAPATDNEISEEAPAILTDEEILVRPETAD